MKISKYILIKEKKYRKYSNINLFSSFDMAKKSNQERIGIIKFYNEEIINYVVTKSVDNHFNKLLDLIVNIEEDGDAPDGLMLCLNETDRFKKELMNKYARFLDKKKKELLMKKIEIVEKEIKNKLIAYKLSKMTYSNMQNTFINNDYEEEMEEVHHRSR